MSQNQKEAAAEFFSAIQRARAEGLLVVFDNDWLHVADYRSLEANGFFNGTDQNGMNADEMALKATPHESIDAELFLVLDKWHFGGAE